MHAMNIVRLQISSFFLVFLVALITNKGAAAKRGVTETTIRKRRLRPGYMWETDSHSQLLKSTIEKQVQSKFCVDRIFRITSRS